METLWGMPKKREIKKAVQKMEMMEGEKRVMIPKGKSRKASIQWTMDVIAHNPERWTGLQYLDLQARSE